MCVRINEKKVSNTSSNSRRVLSKQYYLIVNYVEIKVGEVMFLQTTLVPEKIKGTVSKKLNTFPVLYMT